MSLLAPPLALYVHMPWCVKKCPYCDFNSHGVRGAPPYADYVQALLADLDADLADFGAAIGKRPISSVFFGGGTVEHGRFDGYLAAGVNRISFGIQSFDDAKLQRLGRIHSAGEAEHAVKSAQDAGLSNINLDLMYALPEQSLEQALHDVDRAVALQPTHISHYQLTLEPNTLFAAQPPPLPDDDSAWAMQEACEAQLAAAGYRQYEISAYAQHDRRCAHNLNYWRFGDYLGIGAGAHGKLTDAASGQILRRWKTRSPAAYLAAVGQPARIGGDNPVGPDERPFEYMLNALRLIDGVPMSDFTQRTGLAQAAIATALADGRARGWLEADETLLRTTALGQRFLNDTISLFLD